MVLQGNNNRIWGCYKGILLNRFQAPQERDWRGQGSTRQKEDYGIFTVINKSLTLENMIFRSKKQRKGKWFVNQSTLILLGSFHI